MFYKSVKHSQKNKEDDTHSNNSQDNIDPMQMEIYKKLSRDFYIGKMMAEYPQYFMDLRKERIE